MLCELCKKIKPPHLPVNRTSHPWSHTDHQCLVRHHANFQDLIQSARQGCELCELFRPYVEHAQSSTVWTEDSTGSESSGWYHGDPFEDTDYSVTIRLDKEILYEDEGNRYYIQDEAHDDRSEIYLSQFKKTLEQEEDEDKKSGLRVTTDAINPRDYEIVQWLLQGTDNCTGPEQIWIRGWLCIDTGDSQVGANLVLTLSAGSIYDLPRATEKDTYCVDGKHIPNSMSLIMELPSLWSQKYRGLRVPREEPLHELRPIFEFYQQRGMSVFVL